MNPSFNYLEAIWITIVVLSCISTWTAQSILFNRIKKYSNKKWVEIGEPSFETVIYLDQAKFKKGWLTFKYIIWGDKELDTDKEILRLRNITKGIYFTTFLVVVVFFISSLLYSALWGV